MDEDINAQAWRRVRLGDEPIYCAAPPPSNPDDIVYLGSYEELDDDAKVARRLRYEAQGLRYLQGKPLRIISASLRGPFEKASGWQNPWLPKQPPLRKPVRPHIRKDLEQLVHSNRDTTGSGSSMLCHLPSPNSNPESRFLSNPLETDKHSRIQAWAKDVSSTRTILERDPFWAPGNVRREGTDELSRKRSAGREWLKKNSKRKRLDSPQDTDLASTPTPRPPVQTSKRSRSVPTYTGQAEEPVLPAKIASRSFELATPSSTTNHSIPEATNHTIVPSQDELSYASKPTINGIRPQSTSTEVDNTYDRLSPTGSEGSKYDSNPESSSHPMQATEYATNQDHQQDDGSEEETGLQSYIDQSFHYRAQPPKQTTPVPSPEVPATGICPELTQTGTPESPRHDDVVTVTVAEGEKQCKSPQQATESEQQVGMEPVAVTQASVHLPDPMCAPEKNSDVQDDKGHLPIPSAPDHIVPEDQLVDHGDNKLSSSDKAIIETTETSSLEDQMLPTENINPMHIGPVGASTKPGTTNIPPTKMEAAGNKDLDMVREDAHPPPEVKTLTSTTLAEESVVNTHPDDRELTVDEGSTLVDDPMDTDQNTPFTADGWLTIHHAQNKTKLITTVEPQNIMRKSIEDEVPDKSDKLRVPSSQSERGTTEPIGSSPEKSGVRVKGEIKTLVVKVEEAPGKVSRAQKSLSDSPHVVTQQSPWASDQNPWTSDQSPWASAPPRLSTLNIKSEPIDDGLSPSPCPSHFTLIGSEASTHGIPRIMPSQQSPWARELLAPAIIATREHHASMNSSIKHADAAIVPKLTNDGQSPWVDTSSSITPYHKVPSAALASVFNDEKTPLSHTQSPTFRNEMDRPLLEHSDFNPSTPPRVPVSETRTPELEKSAIKSFAMFNTPSPKRRPRQSSRQQSSVGCKPGILSSAMHSNTGSSRRSSRRVSFAPLSNEEDDGITQSAFGITKAASPPPPQGTADAADEDVDATYVGHFRNHFDALRRRASGENMRPRLQPRLLPSPSQQKPLSPAVSAMAEAFQEADALMAYRRKDMVNDLPDDPDQEMNGIEQSPWRKESQGVDDVAAVMNNLGDFLDAWDVDTEIAKGRQESSVGNQGRGVSR
ncbi:hypothetical protein F4677DRAFT_402752 [Hypoxylon crocopeplum]|nr:hypothetical protein F4677DRAFT_402752 [Hypoxylon crocopeplum]